jgi:hypothetical protein
MSTSPLPSLQRLLGGKSRSYVDPTKAALGPVVVRRLDGFRIVEGSYREGHVVSFVIGQIERRPAGATVRTNRDGR